MAETRGKPVVSIHDVTHRYGSVKALDGISLDIPTGIMVGIVGPDGVGKSTLMGIMAGSKKLQEGSMTVLDGDIGDVRHRPAQNRPPCHARLTGRDGKDAQDGLDRLRRIIVVRSHLDQAVGEPEDDAVGGLAESGGAPGDRVEHRLDVGGRPADDVEDFAGRRLLIERVCQPIRDRAPVGRGFRARRGPSLRALAGGFRAFAARASALPSSVLQGSDDVEELLNHPRSSAKRRSCCMAQALLK